MISENLKKRALTGIILLSLVFFIIKSNFLLIYVLLVFGIFSIIEFINIIKIIIKKNFLKLIFNLIFISFIIIFSFFFFLFSNYFQLKILLFVILLSCVASDIGGYLIGNIFKGPKLSRFSPKKTISGALGSIIFSVFTINVLFFYILKKIDIIFVVTGVALSVSCQLGDLFFSFLKRKAKIKDSGNILPGHGGILDRLDGIYFGLPTGIIIFSLLY